MHELSIATEIISIAEQSARQARCQKINEMELEIGTISGIEVEALETALSIVSRGTMLEKAKIVIHRIQGKARCEECGHEFALDLPFMPCPLCQSVHVVILQGKESHIKTLKAE